VKANARDTGRWLTRPDPATRIFLVFGPDHGLVRERAGTLAGVLMNGQDDAFAVSRLTDDDLKSDPASLADAMAAMSLLGGARLVRLRLSGESSPAANWLADFEKGDAPAEAKLVIEAGDMKKTSKIRKITESSKIMVAIPCYADNPRDLMKLAEDSLAAEGLSLTPDARAPLSAILEGDRQLARSEIEKLILYKGLKDQRQGDDTVTGEDISAVCASGAEAALDQVIDPAMLGEAEAVDRGYARAMESGISPVGILRALQRKIDQIDTVQTADGDPGALARAGVPRFGPPADRFQRTARLWTGRRLEHARALAFETERAVKRSGAPAEALVGALLLRIAKGAKAGR
jgi:DNA polymerase III subunit delta